MKPLEELLEIAKSAKEKADKATAAPWEAKTYQVESELFDVATFEDPCDASFIASARTDVPILADAVIDLITHLKDAQVEIKSLNTFNTQFTRVDKRSWGDLFNEITQLKQDIEKLKKRISWLELGSIHTCHNDCKRHACVMRRKIESLTKKNEILLKGLELIKQYHCACSIDDEIIPQVVARQALASIAEVKL